MSEEKKREKRQTFQKKKGVGEETCLGSARPGSAAASRNPTHLTRPTKLTYPENPRPPFPASRRRSASQTHSKTLAAGAPASSPALQNPRKSGGDRSGCSRRRRRRGAPRPERRGRGDGDLRAVPCNRLHHGGRRALLRAAPRHRDLRHCQRRQGLPSL